MSRLQLSSKYANRRQQPSMLWFVFEFPELLFLCSWGICIIISRALPFCASPYLLQFFFFHYNRPLCPIQHLVYVQLLYVCLYSCYCAAGLGVIKRQMESTIHFHKSLQLKVTGHCSLCLVCFYKETSICIFLCFYRKIKMNRFFLKPYRSLSFKFFHGYEILIVVFFQ